MTSAARARRTLHEKIDRLSDREADVVGTFVDAILTPIYSESLPETWLASIAWTEAFAARLQGYHALSAEPLGTIQFEAAFNHSCDVAGWNVEAAGSRIQQFYDTTISDGKGAVRRLSLKASSAEGMAPSKVHISKLTEGAWIQDARRQADRRNRIVQLFQDYQETTSAIFMLRGFKDRGDFQVLYELVEIPTSIFDPVADLSVTEAQKGTINIPSGTTHRNRHFAIRIDRSDAKVTLTGIRLDKCVVHGRWGLREPAIESYQSLRLIIFGRELVDVCASFTQRGEGRAPACSGIARFVRHMSDEMKSRYL